MTARDEPACSSSRFVLKSHCQGDWLAALSLSITSHYCLLIAELVGMSATAAGMATSGGAAAAEAAGDGRAGSSSDEETTAADEPADIFQCVRTSRTAVISVRR